MKNNSLKTEWAIHLSFADFYVFLFIISFKPQYIIGIDCGATSSEAVASPDFISPTKKELREIIRRNVNFRFTGNIPKKYPPVNFNLLGFDESSRRLLKIIKDIALNYGNNILSLAAGISGARYEADRKKLESYIRTRTKIKHVKILPDTEIALATAFEPNQKNCGILIAGTGSILYYRDSKGQSKQVGGWGRLIGDEGSGYWIARTALSYVTKYYDKRGRKTLLTELIEEKFSMNSDTIINKIYHNGFALSKIARIVFRAAEKGDKISIDIIKGAAGELAGHFTGIKNQSFEIALTGSLFTEEKLLELELKKIIKSKYPNIKLIKPNYKPVWGAVRIARSQAAA